jgi:adenine-specific DNA methylase
MNTMATVTAQKTLGAFYTDAAVAHYVVEWALRQPTDSVLDPSCGGGVFLSSALGRLRSIGCSTPRVWGIDIDGEALRLTKLRLPLARHIQADFFSADLRQLAPFDAVVGNPPFIRYQTFNGSARSSALARAQDAGVSLAQLSSSWAPFLVHAVSFLKPGGRLGMVVPSEIGHAQYARNVLEFIISNFGRIEIRLFRKKLFPELSQDTGLLLCENFGTACSWFSITILDDIEHASTSGSVCCPVDIAALRDGRVRLIHYLVSPRARHLYETLSTHKCVARLGAAADVGIGYVTGFNDFFHLSEGERRRWHIPRRFLRPAILTLADTEAVVVRVPDWRRIAESERKSYLLAIPPLEIGKLPPSVLEYLKYGEEMGVPERFKCRVRQPWFSVPHVRIADAFLTYMSGQGPRLVRNHASLVAPNTLHLVRLEKGWKPEWFTGGWFSSLTKLSCELEGHALGGGMLKLEPSEAGRILVALPNPREAAGLERDLNSLVRQKQADAATDLADSLILRRRLGLTGTECLVLREAAREMHRWRMHK